MLALFFGLFAGLSWSVHDLIARYFASKIGAYRMAFWTLLVGSALLSVIVPLINHGTIQNIDLATAELIVILGVVYGLAVSSLFKAFSMAPVSIVGPFTAGYPALVVIWGVVTGVQPSLLQVIAIALILGGAIVVGRMGADDGGMAIVAKDKRLSVFFFCALASFSFATAVILGQIVSLKLGEIETTFLSRIPAALVLLPLIWREKPEVKAIDIKAWSAVSAMALLDVAAVTGINYMGRLPNKELGAMGISAYGAISVLLAMIILKEKVSAWQWLGIAMIVVGVGALATP
jgi:drug/metabolite transporter (DMT)-like permease